MQLSKLDASLNGHYVIDTSGVIWDVERLVAKHANAPVPFIASAQNLLEELVLGKGYAGLKLTNNTCHIFLNPSKLKPLAQVALQQVAGNLPSQLVISCCYQNQWKFRIHTSAVEALDHIATLIAREQEQLIDCLRSREVTQGHLDKLPVLNKAMDMIRGAGSRFDQEFLANFSELTNDRFLLCSWQPEGQVWRVEQSGSGYGFGRHLNVDPHQTIGNQPSYDYGCWIHNRYAEVMARGSIAVDDVDAVTYASQIGQRRMQYRRVLSPMTDQDGNSLMLSTSISSKAIDLGSGVAASSL